jgi:hypothetical protein
MIPKQKLHSQRLGGCVENRTQTTTTTTTTKNTGDTSKYYSRHRASTPRVGALGKGLFFLFFFGAHHRPTDQLLSRGGKNGTMSLRALCIIIHNATHIYIGYSKMTIISTRIASLTGLCPPRGTDHPPPASRTPAPPRPPCPRGASLADTWRTRQPPREPNHRRAA